MMPLMLGYPSMRCLVVVGDVVLLKYCSSPLDIGCGGTQFDSPSIE
jgi:hypothetical protein